MAAPNRQNKPDLQAEIERYRKSLEENPGSRLFAALADAMRRSGDVAGAITVAENGLKRHPRYLGGMVALGQAYADNGQFDRAKELFLQVVRMNPENIVAQRALADIYEKLGESFNAMRTYAILNILDPSDKKVRARLQELEEARAGASRPASAVKPFSSPPTVYPAEVSAPVVPSPAPPTDNINPSASDTKADPPPTTAEEPPAEAEPPNDESANIPSVTSAGGDAVTSTADHQDVPAPEPATEPPPASVKPEIEQRLAGLNQFFEDDQTLELEVPSAAARPDSASLPSPKPEPQNDEGSNTAVLPPSSPAPEEALPPEPPAPDLSIEEKLDLFFGGADLDQVGLAAKAERFVVRSAQEAMSGPDEDLAPPPLAAGPVVEIAHSKLGAIFWNQGFREKALSVMAEEIKSRPGDPLLRAEFSFAARSIELDPEQLLESLSPGLAKMTAPEATAEPVPVPASEPDASPAASAPPETAPAEPPPAAEPESEGESSSTDQRINILRSYLNRIRKDKES